MSVSSYQIHFLRLQDCSLRLSIPQTQTILQAWRKGALTAKTCTECHRPVNFESRSFALCCCKFYYKPKSETIESLCVETPGVHFLLPYMKGKLTKRGIGIDQPFLVLPDPLYWQIKATLLYERVLSFLSDDGATKLSAGKRLKRIDGSFSNQSPHLDAQLYQFYDQLQNAPLNHCSLAHRTQGKHTFFRKIAIAKRARYTARAMIQPETTVVPNEVVLPTKMTETLGIRTGSWVIVNRMPSLLPENFIALRVARTWDRDTIGIPCEVLFSLGADFDGDEVNIWPVYSFESQAECEILLNARRNMKSFTNGIKLHPSQDMLVAYYLLNKGQGPSLPDHLLETFELYGSERCFDRIDELRRTYLDFFENEYLFAFTIQELRSLAELARGKSFEEFDKALDEDEAAPTEGCLRIQVESKSKGTRFHLYQLVGHVGYQVYRYSDRPPAYIDSSFFDGLTPREYIRHAQCGYEALIDSMLDVWKPGYNYFKMSHYLSSLVVDYEGHVEDSGEIVMNNFLDEMYYKDCVSDLAFETLARRYEFV